MVDNIDILLFLQQIKVCFLCRALDKNEYNHITATYFLLAERKLRAQRQESAQKAAEGTPSGTSPAPPNIGASTAGVTSSLLGSPSPLLLSPGSVPTSTLAQGTRKLHALGAGLNGVGSNISKNSTLAVVPMYSTLFVKSSDSILKEEPNNFVGKLSNNSTLGSTKSLTLGSIKSKSKLSYKSSSLSSKSSFSKSSKSKFSDSNTIIEGSLSSFTSSPSKCKHDVTQSGGVVSSSPPSLLYLWSMGKPFHSEIPSYCTIS